MIIENGDPYRRILSEFVHDMSVQYCYNCPNITIKKEGDRLSITNCSIAGVYIELTDLSEGIKKTPQSWWKNLSFYNFCNTEKKKKLKEKMNEYQTIDMPELIKVILNEYFNIKIQCREEMKKED